MTLDELGTQRTGRIEAVRANGPIGQRLLDMGFLPDAEVLVERIAPIGEPLWVRVCGSQVALRRCEAESVVIHACDPAPAAPSEAADEKGARS